MSDEVFIPLWWGAFLAVLAGWGALFALAPSMDLREAFLMALGIIILSVVWFLAPGIRG